MDFDEPNTKEIVASTTAAGTARLKCFSRLGSYLPEPSDLRGEGLVDFSADRVWMSDRLVTQRIAGEKRRQSNLLTRPFYRVLFRSLERLVGGDEEVLFEGGAVRKRKRGATGSWGPPLGLIDQPKFPRHPLCALLPVEQANIVKPSEARLASKQGIETQCWELSFTAPAFEPEVWREIIDGDKTVSSIQGIVWIDSELRVNRLAFEASRRAENSEALWSITELWDFGVAVDGIFSAS